MSEAKETKNKRKRTIGDVIRTIILIIAIAVFCYAAYHLFLILAEQKRGNDEYNGLNAEYVKDGELVIEDIDGEKVMENPIDFANLKKENSDIVGWITVGAIDISYPIMKYKDNDFYLHHTFEKEYNAAGSIFIDYQNKKDFSDKNTMVYGHNMKSGAMFGKLKNFKKEGVYETDPYFWIYTEDYIYEYQIYSCQELSLASDISQISFASNKKFLEYVKNGMSKSYIDTGVTVDKEDKIVTLYTCTSSDTARFVVNGKLINTYKSK